MTAPLQSLGDRRPARKARIVEALQNECSKLFGRLPQEITTDTSFLALGADSLLLLRMSQTLKDLFGVKVPFRRLIKDLGTVQTLAAHVDQCLFPENAQPVGEEPEAKPVATATPAAAFSKTAGQPYTMQSIFAQQLRVITMQLELLRSPASAPKLSKNVSIPFAKPPMVDDIAAAGTVSDFCAEPVKNISVVDPKDSLLTHDNVGAQEPGSTFEEILSEVQALTAEQVQTAIRNELKIK